MGQVVAMKRLFGEPSFSEGPTERWYGQDAVFPRRAPLLALLCTGCLSPEPVVEPDLDARPPPPLHTPRWAFQPWISKDISTGQDTRDFVRGFQDRDIPVGVVVLDSPWETNYNTFVPHPDRYPDFGGMVQELRGQGIRTVLWVTQMTNDDSFDLEEGGDTYEGPAPNYREGLAQGYFVNDGQRFLWWKGAGGAVDFFNPDAVRWWHRQQDPLLDLGVAGWKLDFGDSYVMTDPVNTKAGPVPHQQYSEAYYRDYWAYGANRLGTEEFLTMVRPYDESYTFPGRFFARKEHCPVGWVGDNRRDFVGLKDALDHLFRSAEAGYVVIGSDIGGYLDRDDRDLLGEVLPFDVEVFARWTAASALMPFFQLHGRANITPWTVPERIEETVAMYRYWATLHQELVPFFYSLAEEAHRGRLQATLRPIGGLSDWTDDYRYFVGDAFLVAPLLAKGGVRQVELPAGGPYYDWWDEGRVYEGGTTVTASMAGDLLRSPLYVRAGAIVPAEVGSPLTGLGDAGSRDGLTLLLAPGPELRTFTLHEEDGTTTTIAFGPEQSGHHLRMDHLARPVTVKLLGPPPSTVSDDRGPLTRADARGTWAPGQFVVEGAVTWIRLAARPEGTELHLAR